MLQTYPLTSVLCLSSQLVMMWEMLPYQNVNKTHFACEPNNEMMTRALMSIWPWPLPAGEIEGRCSRNIRPVDVCPTVQQAQHRLQQRQNILAYSLISFLWFWYIGDLQSCIRLLMRMPVHWYEDGLIPLTVLCPFWQATCKAVCPIASSTSTLDTCCTRSCSSSVLPFTASQWIWHRMVVRITAQRERERRVRKSRLPALLHFVLRFDENCHEFAINMLLSSLGAGMWFKITNNCSNPLKLQLSSESQLSLKP